MGISGNRSFDCRLFRLAFLCAEQTWWRELVSVIAITRTRGHCMRRIALIGLALLAMTVSASARLGIAPLSAQDSAVIQVKGGHGHGHGHMGRGGRGHH